MKRPAKSYKAFPAAGFLVLLILGLAGPAFADTKPKFVYVVNTGVLIGGHPGTEMSTVSGYAIDATTGGLSPVPGSPFAAGTTATSIAVDPSNRFVYVSNSRSNNISAYTVDSTTGALTAVSGSPFPTGFFPNLVAVDPSGKFVYVANFCLTPICNGGNGTISAYAINGTTGALNAVPGSPFAAGLGPDSVTIDPSGKFLYVVSYGLGVSSYTIDRGTGALTPISGSPFAAGINPSSVAVDPLGKFVYVTNIGSPPLFNGTVSGFTTDSGTGALKAIVGSPFAAEMIPTSMTVDPSGKFAYVINQGSHRVSAYTIDGNTGALTPIADSSFAVGIIPTSVAVDSSGEFAYVTTECVTTTCAGKDGVSAYTINRTTGALTPLSGSPFAAGPLPAWLAITHASAVPFEIFKAKADIDEDRKTSFRVEGFFRLGQTSDGIDPVNEAVQLQVGTFSTTIPAGSFWKEGRQEFEFEGWINDVELRITIHHVEERRDERRDHAAKHNEETHKDTKDFLFTAQGKGHILAGVVNPVTVGLTIGDDEGSTTVKADIDK
jgi:6-phosphogluconolactonase